MSRTLKDIARELNLSVTTISRVVNGEQYVKPDKRQLIQDALRRHNYVPNHIARSLKQQETRIVGIIIPDISEHFFSSVVQGIDSKLTQSGYSVLLSYSQEDPKKEDELLNLMYQKRVDALVLATVSKAHTNMELYFNNSIPVVFIDNLPYLETGFDAVLIDNRSASRKAVDHLAKLGHTRIALITGNWNETTGYERLEGYRQALDARGIPFDERLIRYGNYKEESGFREMNDLLNNQHRIPFSAVYVISEQMTCGAMKAIREYGLDIPHDVSLVGFDFHDRSGLISPGITTIVQPENEIGTFAAELLLRRLQEPRNSHQQGQAQKVILEPKLSIRGSTKHKK